MAISLSIRIITTCTDRKRLPIPPRLRASTLPHASLTELAANWLSRVNGACERRPASNVYCGRSFQEAAAAAAFVGSELAIISAGLGLVLASQEIPAYGLTLVRGADDEIGARCVGEFAGPQWWSLIANQSPCTISQMAKENPKGIIVLGLSSTYARLVEQELTALGEPERSKLRIVGLSIARELPVSLREYVLPYDSRLDGPDSPSKGTRSDFASRAIRHFVEVVLPKVGPGGIVAHKKAVSDAIEGWAVPANVVRKSLSDAEIVSVIRTRLGVVGRNSGRMLRHLRDVELIACEQTRFKNLFKRAVEESNP